MVGGLVMTRGIRVIAGILALAGAVSACGSASPSTPSAQSSPSTIAPAVEGHNYVKTGAVKAGLFRSANAIPGLSFRLPTSGWRVVDTWDVALTLRPPKFSRAELRVVTGWYPVTPADERLATSNSLTATMAGLRRNHGITVSSPSTAEIGGGARATAVDLSVAAGSASSGVDFLAGKGNTASVMTLKPGVHGRLFLMAIREPYGRDTMAIFVEGRPADSSAWNRLALSVLRTMRLPDGVKAVS